MSRNRPRLRVVKSHSGTKRPGSTQVHDEDVLRWQLMVSQPDAVVIAKQAGLGGAVLPRSMDPPMLSPERCRTAGEYVNVLPPDVRNSIYKHCEAVTRNERLLLEGQERLKYVQAQVREMKAHLPPLPPFPAPPRKGEVPVTVRPVPHPSCWATCCGCQHGVDLDPASPTYMPVAPPDADAARAAAAGAAAQLARITPMAIEMPPPSYFQEQALAHLEARRRAVEREAGPHPEEPQWLQVSAGGASASSVQPVGSSVGGASGGGATAHAAGGGRGAAAAGGTGPRTGELPGQLDRQSEGGQQQAAAGRAKVVGAAVAAAAGGVDAEVEGGTGVLGGSARGAAAPLGSNAPGTPQSLLRPLGPAKGLPPVQRTSGAGAAPAASAAAPGQHDASRYQDAESLRKITAIQAAERGRVARKQVAAMKVARGAASTAAAGGLAPSGRGDELAEWERMVSQPMDQTLGERDATALVAAAKRGTDPRVGSQQPYDTSRYQDPESIRKITAVQAAERGRVARRQVADMKAARPPGPPAAPPAVHPFADPAYGASHAAPASAAAGGTGAASSSSTYETSRYQDPESIRKITAIQAAERGRVARKQVAAMKATTPASTSVGAAPAAHDPYGGAPAGGAEGGEAAVSEVTFAPGALAAALATPSAASGAAAGAGPYDTSRYQDAESLRKITAIQAAERGRVARKQVAAMKAGR